MADRSVTVRLTADIKPFVTAMAKAEAAAKKLRDGLGDSWEPFERETQKQKQRAPRQAEEVAGAFVRSFVRQVDAAAKQLPKLKLSADSSDAQIKLATLRQALVDLSGKTIGVDINAASALGELRAIQGELERLNTSAEIDVRADASAALAQLQSVQREVDRLGGETARVDVDADTAGAQSKLAAVGSEASRLDGRNAQVRVSADVSGALTGIAMVGAALAALPAAATIGLGVGALGGAFAAAGAGALGFAAVAGPSLGRVNEALKEAESSAGGAGGAMKSAAQKAAEAAQSALSLATAQDAVADSAAAVKASQQGVKDALQGVGRAQADAAQAADDAAYRQAAASRRIEDAERSAADAHRATQRAIEDLTRARERAQERIEDLALATEGGALSEERALLSIQRAQADLARTNADPKSSSLDKDDAALRVKEAEFGLKRIREANGDLAQEQQKADQQGVEGSDEVVAAKERVEAASRAEADAERAVSDARTAAARDAVAGARSVAEANGRVAEAQRKVGEAQQDVIKAQRDAERAASRLKIEQLQQKVAMEQAGAAAGGAATKMSKLSEAERELAKDIKDFQDNYKDWQKSLQADIFPVIRSGMDLLTTGMAIGTPLIKASAGAFNDLIKATNEGLQGEQWTSFFDDMTAAAPRAIEGLGNAAGNVAGGLAGIIQAFLPYTDDLMTWIEDISQKFEDWGQGLSDSQGFKSFVAYAAENAPRVGEILGNIAKTAGDIVEAFAPFGAAALVGLSALSSITAGMDPGHIQGIAIAVAAVYGAIKAGQAISAAGDALSILRGSLDKTGDSAGTAKTKLGTMASSLVAGGPWGLAIGAGIGVLGLFIDKHFEGKQKVADFTQAIKDDSGALGENTRAKVANILQEEGLLKAAKDAGISLSLLTDGILGNKDAYALAERQIQGVIDTEQDKSTSDFSLISSSLGRRDAAQELMGALKGESGHVRDATEAAKLNAEALGGTKTEANLTKTAIENLSTSMSTFAGKTDALKAERDLKQAFDDTTKALEATNGKLDINAGMNDKMKNAVILARDQYQGYIEKVDALGKSQQVAGKNTADSTIAVADQLPKLFELAGKSKDAKDAVYDLAAKYGISKTQADLAAKGTKAFKDELALIKSKAIKVDIDTKTAQAQLDNLQRTIIDIARRAALGSVGGLNTASARGNAWGGIQYADGRPDYMAQGGIRSLGSNPNAMIAKSPYMISGRGGPNVVFGESGMEAYIPLSAGKRDRGLQIMQEAAGIMGMAVVPEQLAIQGASSVSGGGGGSFGPALVTITGIDALRSSLDTTALDLTGSLGTATSTLDATLGDAGSLTTSLDGVGAAAGVLATEVTGWGEVISVQVPPLTTAVSELSKAVTSAASAAKSAAGSKADEGNPRDSAPGYVAGAGPASKSTSKNTASLTKTMVPRNNASAVKTMKDLGPQPGYIEGYANGGITDRPAIFGEAGLEAAVPLGAGKRSQGLQVLGQAAQHLGATVNYSRASKPVQSSYSGSSGAGGSWGGTDVSQIVGQLATVVSRIDSMERRNPINIESMQVREQADIDEISAKLAFRRGARG